MGFLCSHLDQGDIIIPLSDHIFLFTHQIKYYNIAVLVMRLFISMLFAVQLHVDLETLVCNFSIYYINTSEIPRELSRENFISSHVKRSPSLWLHNKSHLWKQADLVFHWCLYNKQDIMCTCVDMNFIFTCSTRYLTCSLCLLVRYRVDHLKIKFLSTHGHVISSMYLTECISGPRCSKPD